MTYTAEQNIELHVVRQRIAPLEREWFQCLSRGMGSVAFGREHDREELSENSYQLTGQSLWAKRQIK